MAKWLAMLFAQRTTCPLDRVTVAPIAGSCPAPGEDKFEVSGCGTSGFMCCAHQSTTGTVADVPYQGTDMSEAECVWLGPSA
jgi:hypothetical protein